METKTKMNSRRKQTRFNDSTMRKFAQQKNITVGTICDVEISALGPTGVGIATLSRNISVFVPNTVVGETAQIEITKIQSVTGKVKYAIARKIKTIKSDSIALPEILGTVLQVRITKTGPLGSGQAEYSVGNTVYPLIVPNATVGNEYSVLITRLKRNYGFAKIIKQEADSKVTSNSTALKAGSFFTVTVPARAPRYGKFIAIKMRANNESVVALIRLGLGAKAGQRVRVQVTKTLNTKIQDAPVVLAKVIKLAPLSASTLKLRTRQAVRQMVKNGLHFGDKTVKCQANMKKYLWSSRRANSGLRPVVKNGRYFVNLLKTRQCLTQALKAVSKYAAKGRTFLFVGTSKISSSLIARAALFSKNFFVNTRWLGGMLTNWKTIVKSISKIRPILQQKQEIMTQILQKRQRIKQYFLSKLDKLNTKTKLLVQIGRTVLNRLQTNAENTQGANWVTMSLVSRSSILMQKRQQLIEKAQLLFTKRQQLLAKCELLDKTNQQLFSNVTQLQNKYAQLTTQYNLKCAKLQEFKALLVVSVQLNKLAQQQASLNPQGGQQTYVGPYAQLTKSSDSSLAIVPSPPKELFNKIILAMRAQTEGASFATAKNEKGNFVIFSKLLIKFSQSSSYLQEQIKTLHTELQLLGQEINATQKVLTQQKEIFAKRLQIKQAIYKELTNVRTQLAVEQKIVSIVKTKLMRLDAQRRLLSFIPRVKALTIRYNAVGSMNAAEANAAQQNIQQTVQLVMRRLVDPKMKYSIDKIFDAKLRTKSKKTAAIRKKKWQSLLKYFGGIANMTKLTRKQISNNIAIIIGQQENMNAVRECKKMGIKMLNIVDTNCNPALADHIIPANDDSRNSIKYVLTQLLTYIRLAQKLRTRMQQVQSNTKKVQKLFKGTVTSRSKKVNMKTR
uniref:Small ribosomal subunit protein uS2c n=1 Tax=Hafniomonas laevis TaxID=436124 RepID=A0A0S2LNT0_9CHLO|nr:ribosomal protein S2 [Hafniomonas laevis]ALO63072.1 ribosomal protein S2 [Hafniomonas laevis]